MSSTPTTHWIVPFAASLSEPCQHALPRLAADNALPNLRRLLSHMQETERLEGDEYALSMPHERVLARSMGWLDTDGLMPWASWWAAQDGVKLDPQQIWGMLSPGHWLMGRDHLTLLDPATLGLSEGESRTVFDAIRPLFEEDGWTLLWGSAQRWYAAHPSLAGLPTASLDRVIGRNPDVWMPDHPQARLIKRLQNEVQMLMYEHPLNDERQAAGRLSVNSFWLSGTGALPGDVAPTAPSHQRLITGLRAPLLASNLADWISTWQTLDATILRDACAALDAGQTVHLSLCGERSAVTLSAPATPSLAQRLLNGAKHLLGRQTVLPSALLATL